MTNKNRIFRISKKNVFHKIQNDWLIWQVQCCKENNCYSSVLIFLPHRGYRWDADLHVALLFVWTNYGIDSRHSHEDFTLKSLTCKNTFITYCKHWFYNVLLRSRDKTLSDTDPDIFRISSLMLIRKSNNSSKQF